MANLKTAGLIEYTGNGYFNITERGKELLKENPGELNIQFLKNRFPDYGSKSESDSLMKNADITSEEYISANQQTPEEQINFGYGRIRKSLEIELLAKLKIINPYFLKK